MNKRAIELSINFIVILILSIAMFAAGFFIMKKVFTTTNQMKETLSDQQKTKLEQILANGAEPVKAIYSERTLRPGGHDVFGLGIRNDLGYKENFTIEADFDIYIDSKGEVKCDSELGCTLDPNKGVSIIANPDSQHMEVHTVANNERAIVDDIYVYAAKGAEKGTYVFNIKVCQSDHMQYDRCECPPGDVCQNQYSTTKKLNVVVN